MRRATTWATGVAIALALAFASQADALITLELRVDVALADGQVSETEIDWLGQRLIIGVFGGARRANEQLRTALGRVPHDNAGRGRFVRGRVGR